MEPTTEQIQQEIIKSEERTSEHLRSSTQTKAARLEICSTCSSKTTMFGLEACSECNCVLGFKVSITTVTCPKGKW